MGKKIVVLLLTVLFAVIATFFIIELMPGNPVELLAKDIVISQGISYQDAYRKAITLLNYDPSLPMHEKLLNFAKDLMSGNMGVSLKYKADVLDIVLSALPWTLLVAGTSTLIAFVVGVTCGMFAAWKKSKTLNLTLDTTASIMGAIPEYILGFFLIVIFSVSLKIFPSRGAYSTSVDIGLNFPFIIDVAKHATLPILAFFIVNVVNWITNMRATAVNILGEDYIQYANARGLSNKDIIFKYVGKNALLPMITSLASTFGMLVGGAPLIEDLFAYPGVGYYLGNATGARDAVLMQGMFFTIIITVILCNFLVELLYGYIDPRLRRKGGH